MDFETFSKIINKDLKLLNKKFKIFSEDFIPDDILYRDNEINSINQYIISRNNILLTGDVGNGKTLCVKWIYNNIPKLIKDIKLIYHNCRASTLLDVFYDICKQLNIDIKKRQSVMTYIWAIQKSIKKDGIKNINICLDEVNHLINKYNDPDLLYSFVDPTYITNVNLILISNTSGWYENVSKKTDDRLKLDVLEFNNYNIDEIRGILEQRLKIGTTDNVVSLKEIGYIAESVITENYTIREAINMLSKIYDYKKLNNITHILTQDKISFFISQIKKDGMLTRFKVMKPYLRLCIYCLTIFFTNRQDKDYITVEHLTKQWNKESHNNPKIKERKSDTMRNYLNELITYGYIKKKNVSRKGAGYILGYIPLFNIEEFMIYFKTEYGD